MQEEIKKRNIKWFNWGKSQRCVLRVVPIINWSWQIQCRGEW